MLRCLNARKTRAFRSRLALALGLPVAIAMSLSPWLARRVAATPLELGTRVLELEQAPLRVELFETRAGARRLYLIRAWLPADALFQVLAAPSPTPLERIVGERAGVALNGGFYDEAGRAMGLVMQNAHEASKLRRGGGSGVLAFGPRGFSVVHRRDELPPGTTQAIQSIDRLVADARSLIGPRASPSLDARSAVATFADGSARMYVFFASQIPLVRACDTSGCTFRLDAGSSSSGISLGELAEFLVAEGARSALNLDGGYSTSFEARLSGKRLRVIAFRATINALFAAPGRAP
jgi:hypothetical protein